MGVRRVPFKDWVWETTGNAPARWNKISGGTNWTVQGNTVEYNNTAALQSGTVVAPAEFGVQLGTIPQSGVINYDVKMKIHAIGAFQEIMHFIVFGSATVGAYLGNSYLLAIDTANTYFYRSDANVLSLLATTGATHTVGTTYTFTISVNDDGDWTFTENGTPVGALDTTDTTYTSGNYIGLRGEQVQARWSEIRVRRDWSEGITSLNYTDYMFKATGSGKFGYIYDDLDSSEFTIGEGVEFSINNGTTDSIDFYGKITNIEFCDEGPDEVTVMDWRCELLAAEGYYTGTAKIDAIMQSMIDTKCRVLTSGGITATADTAKARTINGESLFEAIKKFCEEAGYFILYDGTGRLSIGSSTSASGLTITNDDIVHGKYVLDLVANVNTVKSYYSGGSTTTGGSGVDYNTYGRAEKLMIDTSMPSSTEATSRANYYINRYSGGSCVFDIWLATMSLNALRCGDTGTITAGWFGFTSETFLVVEKEINTENGKGTRLRLQITPGGSPVAKMGRDYEDVIGSARATARWGLGQQV